MNDDQRIWIIGSFIHFACNDGFSGLKGYDLSEADAKGMMAGACCLLCFLYVCVWVCVCFLKNIGWGVYVCGSVIYIHNKINSSYGFVC